MRSWRQKIFWLILLFLPTQLGRHFWPEWTQVLGLRIDYLSPTIYLTDILIFFLLVLSLSEAGSFFKKNIRKPWLLLLFLFFLWLSLGIFQAANPWAGIMKLLKMGEFIFLGVYVSRAIKSRLSLQKILTPLFCGVIFEAIIVGTQFLEQKSIGSLFWLFGERTFSAQTPGIAQAELAGELFLRPYGTFSHPNVLAGFLVVVLVLAAYLGTKSLLTRLTLAAGFLTLFLSMSRVAWIAGFSIGFYWLAKQSKWLIVAGLFLFVISLGLMYARFETLVTTDRESWQRRNDLNLVAAEMIKARPLSGVGLGNFLVELPNFYPDRGRVRFLQPAHNLYLMIGAEAGLITLAAFLVFIFMTYRRLRHAGNLVVKHSLIIALSVIFFLSFFDHYFYTLQQGQLLFSLILGLSWAEIKN
ncbi:O-antigen ligase family protein [Candidatus Microgenomates bacterium]|nr:O-antigen ligase family protein [Candidatus Microgenomates bacterium]